ncbi:MAG: putative TIM-barrel fold metal-dependent hydrolase [Candidatus Aldehydirespiratoraceae bacterium]|jgi:predicted TIM-barrel fold metal-dependent hydrolase
MRHGYKVFDADAHVIYPADLWQTYLPEKYRHRLDRKSPAGLDTYNPVTVDGRWSQHKTSLYGQFQKAIGWTTEDMLEQYGDIVLEGFTGDRVANALAIDGIDFCVIYGPEYDMWLSGIDPELQAAMTRAYNRWGADMRESSDGRVITSGPVPLNDVGRAVEEIQYAYDELGIRCFWTRPGYTNHRNLGDRYYDPIYELLQDLDCAFATHEFMGLNAQTEGVDRFDTFTEWHTVVHAHEAQNACMSMIVNGVFERFPRLRTAYMEAGCGWLPSWLHRIDEHLEMAGEWEFPELTMTATEYFKRNCWISTECEDPFVIDVIRSLGDDRIVWESDFPHPDSKYPGTVQYFLDLEPDLITEESKRKIMWDNAVDLYRFPEEMLPTNFIEATEIVSS